MEAKENIMCENYAQVVTVKYANTLIIVKQYVKNTMAVTLLVYLIKNLKIWKVFAVSLNIMQL